MTEAGMAKLPPTIATHPHFQRELMTHYSVLANPDDGDVGSTQTSPLAPIQFSSQVIKSAPFFFLSRFEYM
jgi:hypothetical protein